jgi:hypothetical protein
LPPPHAVAKDPTEELVPLERRAPEPTVIVYCVPIVNVRDVDLITPPAPPPPHQPAPPPATNAALIE